MTGAGDPPVCELFPGRPPEKGDLRRRETAEAMTAPRAFGAVWRRRRRRRRGRYDVEQEEAECQEEEREGGGRGGGGGGAGEGEAAAAAAGAHGSGGAVEGASGSKEGKGVKSGESIKYGDVARSKRPIGVKTRAEAIREAELANLKVAEINASFLVNLQQLPDDKTTFALNIDCSDKEYSLFLDALHQHSLRVAPFTVPVKLNGVKVEVPVTPLKPDNVEDYTYHTIILRCPSDGSEIHILVEDHSGYIKAIKVVLPGEDPSQKPWHRLGKDPLHSRYTPSDYTKYGEGYTVLDGSICMHKRMFKEIFDFFRSFNDDPNQEKTIQGEIILSTTYISFGEAPRFPEAKQWVSKGLLRDKNNCLWFPLDYPALVHTWGVLSKAVFSLYIALLEERLGNKGKPAPDAYKSMVAARIQWQKAQISNKVFLFFHQEEEVAKDEKAAAAVTPIYMQDLCGSHISLLRHDYPSCNKVILRRDEYSGYFSDDIEDAYAAGKLY